MTSRRTFLQTGARLAGAALVPPSSAGRDSASATPLPAAIANLKSLKQAARPITREERRERQEKARALMEANGLDAIVLMEGTSLHYFTGIRWWGGERMFAMVLPAKGAAGAVPHAGKRNFLEAAGMAGNPSWVGSIS